MIRTPHFQLTRRGALAGSGLLAAFAGAARAQIPPAAAPSPAPTAPPAPDPAEVRLHADWAFLDRYREENAVDAARPAAERRVVFLGDSITQGWRERRPEFFADHGFLGRGISGQTSPQMLVRFPFDVAALKPRAVHILAGTNDVAQNTGPYRPEATQGWIMAMVELARAHRIAVILGSAPPAAAFPWHPGLEPAAGIAELNAWIRSYADEHGLIYADYTAVLDDGRGGMRAGLALDGVHPNAEGYAVMETVTLQAVKAALRRRR